MGQTPTKAIIAGVAGALGVVATTQVPMVQAAVDQLANMTQDTKHVKRVSTANDAEKLKSAHRGVTKKSDIVRAQSTSTTPQFEAVADELPVEPSLAPVLETNSHAEIAATSEVDTPTSLSVADDVLQSTAPVTASYVYTAPSASETSTMVSSAPATPAEQAVVSEATRATASPADATRYTVQDGDTLGNIATTIGVPVETIIALNPDVVSGSLTATQRQTIVTVALKYAGQGIPYVWGGKTPAGFDCSGLAAWVYQDAGLSLPSYTVSEESYVATTDVRTKADVMAVAQPGDLLFWGGHGASWHVAIYIGGGQYVAAPAPGKNVQIETVDEVNFMPNFIGSYNI